MAMRDTTDPRTALLARLGQSGAALMLALLMVSILIVVVMETLRAMQVEQASAYYFRDSLQAECLAKSGVRLAMAVLAQDAQETEVDHPGETWAMLPEPEALPVSLGDTGTLLGEVRDEAGRFPINSLVDEKGVLQENYQRVLERLLIDEPFNMEPEEARRLVMAIKDWLDEDDEPTGLDGAEANYYQSQQMPATCKNGPMSSLAELTLVRGMTASLYYGEGENPGLKDLLTVYGEGKINVNTAGPLVLQALVSPEVSEETAADWAQEVIRYREEPMHWDFLGESDWYRNRMPGFNDISLATELITTRSSHFSVLMTGEVGAGRKSVFACLERGQSEEAKEDHVEVSVRYWQVF